MAPKLRTDTEIQLLGNPASVLNEEWITAMETDTSTDCILPFQLPRKLPTRGEVTKLYWYLRQMEKYRYNTKQSKLADIVVSEVMKYWKMSNIETVYEHRVKKKVLSVVKEYEDRRKNFSQSARKEEQEKRNLYVASLENIFDITSPKAVEILQKNRLLGNKEKEEDLCFLEDQRGQRVGYMSDRDKVYDNSIERKNVRDSKLSDQIKQEKERVLSRGERLLQTPTLIGQ